MQNVWSIIRPSLTRWLPVICVFLGFHLWLQVVSLTIEGSLLEHLEVILPWGLASMFFLTLGVLKKHSLSLFLVFPMTVVFPLVFLSNGRLLGPTVSLHFALTMFYVFMGLLYMRNQNMDHEVDDDTDFTHHVVAKKTSRLKRLPWEMTLLNGYAPIFGVLLMSLPFFYAPLRRNLFSSFEDRLPYVLSLAYVLGALLFYGMHQMLTQKTYRQYKRGFPMLTLRGANHKTENRRAYWRMTGLALAILVTLVAFGLTRTL